MNRRGQERGFTLIELIVVMAVLAILAGVAIPKFIDLTNEAKVAAVNADVGAIRSGIMQLGAKNLASQVTPRYPTSIDDSGIFGAVIDLASTTDITARWKAGTGAGVYETLGLTTNRIYTYNSTNGTFLQTGTVAP